MKRFIFYLTLLFSAALSYAQMHASNYSRSVMGLGVYDTVLTPQPDVWHVADTMSVRNMPDSIPCADSYTLFAVVRNPEPDTAQWLWCFAENDTLVEAVHTQGIYSKLCGVVAIPSAHDFSRWSVYRYHSGCRCDSTRHRRLSVGSHEAFAKDSAFADSLQSAIEIKECAYFSGSLSKDAGDIFQTYLALKYGITFDYAPYLSCTGDTLWHPEHDAPWYHHIIGVGHDTARAWYANQSVSLDTAVFTISVDTLTPGEYILLGDNGASLYPSVQADGSFRVEREWLLRPYTQHGIPVRLVLPLANIPDVPHDSLWLLVSDMNGLPLYVLPMNADLLDNLCTFTLPSVSNTPLVMSLWGDATHPSRHKQQKQSDGSQTDDAVWYDAESGNIIAGVQWNGRSLTALLYDSSGKLMSTLSACLPLPVSQIPGNICHVEIVSDGTIVGNIILPVNR